MNVPDIEWLPEMENLSLAKELVALTLKRANSVKPGNWAIFPKKGGQILGASLSAELKAILIHPQIIPIAVQVAVLDVNEQHVFLPAEQMEDLLEVCRRAYTPSLPTLVVFHEFCSQDFGLVQRKVPPVRLESIRDLVSIGLNSAFSIPTSPNESLWWQRWGGELFSVSYGQSFFNRRRLRGRVGRFERLPFNVMR